MLKKKKKEENVACEKLPRSYSVCLYSFPVHLHCIALMEWFAGEMIYTWKRKDTWCEVLPGHSVGVNSPGSCEFVSLGHFAQPKMGTTLRKLACTSQTMHASHPL
eukprot:TRINITY_DN7582_c0_g1_i1.p2 TRINITY_DN7582_c0_g1~~TRINITY_DN7582_c0_g1_i1.p2  ORF type:complete len:105 (-),score=2.45 TRINITY_DN7582_c0_g1_i1:157-471(-)